MEPYAVIETGGKQYLVHAHDTLKVERLETPAGGEISLSPVLALSDGNALEVGAPEVAGAKVSASVVDHIRGDKLYSFKKKRRKGYRRKVGHRQDLTVLKICAIEKAAI